MSESETEIDLHSSKLDQVITLITNKQPNGLVDGRTIPSSTDFPVCISACTPSLCFSILTRLQRSQDVDTFCRDFSPHLLWKPDSQAREILRVLVISLCVSWFDHLPDVSLLWRCCKSRKEFDSFCREFCPHSVRKADLQVIETLRVLLISLCVHRCDYLTDVFLLWQGCTSRKKRLTLFAEYSVLTH